MAGGAQHLLQSSSGWDRCIGLTAGWLCNQFFLFYGPRQFGFAYHSRLAGNSKRYNFIYSNIFLNHSLSSDDWKNNWIASDGNKISWLMNGSKKPCLFA